MSRAVVPARQLFGRMYLAAPILFSQSLVSNVLAQEGSIVVGQRREQVTKAFDVSNIRAELELIARTQRDKLNFRDRPTEVNTETLFFENFLLSADAYIIHPNVVDIDIFSKLELSQQDLDSDTLGTREQNQDQFVEYDVRSTFVRKGQTPLTLFGRQTQNLVERDFAGTLESTTSEYGANLLVRSQVIPSTFIFSRLETEQRSQGGQLDYGLDQYRFLWHSDVLLGPEHELTWDYEYDNVNESGNQTSSASFDRHEATLVHRYLFGDSRRNYLRSRLNVQSQVGDFAYDRYSLEEHLEYWHSDDFRTDYWYTLQYRDRAGYSTTDHRAWWGFSHQLYESLTSTGRLGVAHLSESDGFTSNEFFADVSEEYRKRVPYGAILGNLFLNYNQQDNSERGSEFQVLDDARTFNDPNPIILSRPNILPGSIVVSDLNGIQIYVEGIDYAVVSFPDRIELRRLIGGDINDGETVLIDYRVGPEPGNTISTTTVGVGVRYDIDEGWLRGLGVYARYIDTNRDLDTRDPSAFSINNTTDLIFGAEYRQTPLHFIAEYQIREADISPFQSLSLSGEYRQRFGPRSSLSFNARHDRIRYTDDNDETEFTYLLGRWQEDLGRHLTLNLEAIWRLEDERSLGTTEAWEQEAELVWNYRKTEVFLQARNVLADTPASENEFQLLQIGFRRQF